ncbi:RNA-binding domain-containing protein [Trichodelitschia bisporula]|uniref:RNA-binding domain-containing protein n=1 Tax=Trichodelitschia bisporula TaxID=703511 RepID=A0A6G1I797_9PEZI|nr:RNA-binding domain-containing protein [Trichodelitschia bisporula]
MADIEMEVDPAPPAESTSEPRTASGAVAVRSIEGWIIMVTNVHEEANEEDLQDLFGEWGEIRNMHLNLDRRTGYVKGYVLIEYSTLDEAKAAIAGAEGHNLLDQVIHVDFAFVRPPPGKGQASGGRGGRAPAKSRARSRSPNEARERRTSHDRDGDEPM